MDGKTTIQVLDVTKEELEGLKDGDKETFDSVVWRLIEHYKENTTDGTMSETRVREIANEQIADRVIPEAQE